MPLRPVLLPLLAVLAGLGACTSPLGGRDLELFGGPVLGPGPGVRVGIAQRMLDRPRYDVDVEVELAHQVLDEEEDRAGRPVDDGWDQVMGGLRVTTNPGGDGRWFGRAGVTWVRAQGDPVFLDETGDYGGLYVGVGYVRRLTPYLSTGPDLTLLAVLPEGSGATGGVIPQLGWNLTWHL